ncbi:2-hydroxyacid dehydrogenase [Aureibacter tunicatorum]|uniref:D-lactate dehydrogenase n=1 Tax=Aureibacter tunicatorum TaxID=866807 RepID=A0AAE3XJG0_9BACT|nr:2-hydroxyacid dehydrogenase [Aureibacter tunicatorum]MDR6237143.1 D-lactate dehydrogenase [Aureibacter tunicatorum]BDD06135.1 lactate dehydrogenase [Aureibacter tunicatorum]
MKIAVFSTKAYDKDYLERYNTFGFKLTFYKVRLTEETAHFAKGHDAVCVFVNDQITAEVLEILKEDGVQMIALRCAGFNNVDLEKAMELKMPVLRVPAYSPHAVAEHALALILTLNRKTHKAYNRVRDMNFSLERLEGFDLYNKTVGVIGTGIIGSVFAKVVKSFGCRVIAFDVKENEELTAMGVEYASLEDLLPQCDIVSLHCPLLPSTYHLINKETLKLMKPGSMLINTSRGALVNTKHVIKALKSRHLGYLGMDVYEMEDKLFFRNLSEKIIEDDQIARLLAFPNVLITAHQAFFTDEALTQISKTTLNNVNEFANHLPLTNQVTF